MTSARTPRRRDDIFADPDVLTILTLHSTDSFKRTHRIKRLWYRRALGRGSCLEQPGAVPAVERYSEQTRQLRWLEDDGRVTVFRDPSNNSNGNSFDFDGRHLSLKDFNRRVVRWENDGNAQGDRRQSYQGKPLNSPNDLEFLIQTAASGLPIPPYGDKPVRRVTPNFQVGPTNPNGRLNPQPVLRMLAWIRDRARRSRDTTGPGLPLGPERGSLQRRRSLKRTNDGTPNGIAVLT